MKRKNVRKWMGSVLTAALAVVLLGITGCSDQADQPVSPQAKSGAAAPMMGLSKDNPGVQRAMEVQNRNTERFLENHEIVGTGTGMTDEGEPAVIVYTKKELGSKVIPATLEGIPVLERIVGEVEPLSFSAGGNTKPAATTKKVPGSASTTIPLPSARHPRPVPIGISTGNIYVCGGGTIGVRVRDIESTYALSCNHVWGRLNAAVAGEKIVQPAGSDAGCAQNLSDVVGAVAAVEPIIHLSTANNIMDATLVTTSAAEMSNSTPLDGYGIPSSNPVEPVVGLAVQKYGRTTGLTKGKISAINVTLGLNYGYGTARFVGQIAIEPARKNSDFCDTGDSGSLIVTNDSNADPVGLLFARAGSLTYANPIGPILSRFNVVIDGK